MSCDIEGLAGIATFDMEKEDTRFYLRELYHQHVAWLIEGIQKSAKKMNKLQKLLLPIRIVVD